MTKSRRVTVSLPPDTLDQLDFVAHRLRFSRSALLSVLLNESLPALSQLAQSFPAPSDDPTELDVRRFRGESARVIGDLLQDLQDLTGEPDNGGK